MRAWRAASRHCWRFKEQYVESTVAAQVIGTSGSEQSRVLYIDKGSQRRNQDRHGGHHARPASSARSCRSSPTSSQVLPINDQFSGVGVVLKDTRLQGILKGAAKRGDDAAIHHERREGRTRRRGPHQRRRPHLSQRAAGGEGRHGRARQRPVPQHSRHSLVASRSGSRKCWS